MTTTRRSFLAGSMGTVAGLGLARMAAGAGKAAPALRVGVCDWSAGLRGKVASVEFVKKIGLDGVQISPAGAAEKLSYSDPKVQEQYKAALKKTGMAISSVGLTVTNACPLATDPRGAGWLVQTVDAAAALGCTATLIAFFGKGSLLGKGKALKKAEVDSVVAKLKEAAPHAKAKGVFLGLENTLSAKQNLEIIDRVGSDAVQVYYDIANSTGNGYDVPAEIRLLKGRICEFHFKNSKGVFGENGIKLGPIVEAIKETGYGGWLIMERCFGKDKAAYFQKNAAAIRQAIA